ncbi:hypothetical protein CPB84DRAFT_1787989 [Gymnopilus junonius]|uniref:NAD(P)-binding protein n=1 Tax=Gymnopilus junonius TaxID=109634 RepID=A0A9P5NEL5_GYMJU|nr:hypothetical protein CPB84DRAFT_1787989 [Gymnopilus junonius]
MSLSVSISLSLLVVVVAFYYTQTNSAMPSLAAIRASNAAFFRSKPAPSSAVAANVPTAVFVGGTSGIGEGMALTYAEHTEGKSNIIIVGRNAAAAERIFASMPSPPADIQPKLAREFVQCDATLMKNVHVASQTILSRYPKINYLVMSPGYSTLVGRDETPEGIDRKLAVHYYARWKFLHDLLPGLKDAQEKGEKAAVVSVMAAGHGGKIDLEDLGLKKGYSLSAAALAAPTYNDLMMESFAEQAPNVTFIHAFPGFVRTSLGSSSPSPTLRIVSPSCSPSLVPSPTAVKPGAWRVGSKGEDLGMKRHFGDEVQRKKVWEHTVEVMRAALASSSAGTSKAGSRNNNSTSTLRPDIV